MFFSICIEKQNEEALLNAFKIEELEERLEMAPWSKKEVSSTTGWPAQDQIN